MSHDVKIIDDENYQRGPIGKRSTVECRRARRM